MQSWTVFRVGNTVKQLWMIFYYLPIKGSTHEQTRRPAESFIQEWVENITKEVSIIKTSLQYMGNKIFIENKKVCVKPLRNRLEAIQELQPPKTPKGCMSFVGVVKFLSMFCPELQKVLKPIYDLTRKGRPFNWGKEQQDSL